MTRILKNKIFKNTTILTISLIVIEILFKVLLNQKILDWSIIRIVLSSLILSYFISLITVNIKKTWILRTVNLVLVFAISFYSLIQMGFYNYLGNYMSINTSSQLGKVTDYIQDYFMSFSNRFYFILVPFLLLVLYYIFIDKRWKVDYVKHTIGKYIYSFIMLGIVCEIYYFTLIVGFMQNKYQLVQNEKLFANPSLQNVAVNQFGVSTYVLLDLKSLFIESDNDLVSNEVDLESIVIERNIDSTKWLEITENEDDKEYSALNNYFISREITKTNEYTGLFEDKNLIVIMLESVNWISYNEEYFPNLYKIYSEGWMFENNYSPRNNCSTGNNEFSALTSLFSINNMCSANVYKDNTYFQSMFNLFKNKDYAVSSFHNYTDYYYFRQEIHPNLGSKYYGVEDLGIPYVEVYQEWPSDISLIEESYPIFTSDEKFMTYLTTVTTHQPYYRNSEYGDMYVDDFKDLDISIEVKRYMSKMKILDQALGVLLEKLDSDGILDDTVIVMFGDHYPYGISNEKLQPMFDYDVSVNSEVDRTPFVIYNSEQEGKVIDSYTTYINILPTIANLFNLDYDPRYYMGEDLFDENYSGRAIFANGSWQSEYAFYDTTTGILNYINDDYEYTSDEIISINQDIYNRLNYSSLAIKNNYFKYLYDKLNSVDEDIKVDLNEDSIDGKS